MFQQLTLREPGNLTLAGPQSTFKIAVAFPNMSWDAPLMWRDILCPALAMSVGTRLRIVMFFQMAHPLVFPNETSARAGCIWTGIFRIDIMSCGNVPLEIVICPEGGFMFAMLHCADERINVNIVEMCLEDISAPVGCFWATFVPSALPTRTPAVAHVLGVLLNVAFVLLNAIEHTQRRALRPIAPEIFDRDVLKIELRRPRRRWPRVNREKGICKIGWVEFKMEAQAAAAGIRIESWEQSRKLLVNPVSNPMAAVGE
jgi:hypothetical protein